jgi:hypothetical protein
MNYYVLVFNVSDGINHTYTYKLYSSYIPALKLLSFYNMEVLFITSSLESNPFMEWYFSITMQGQNSADYYSYRSTKICCIILRWVHTCNVTAYRNTVSWRYGRDSWPRYVSKVGYAVTLQACSLRCRYLAVASKEWYGYGLSRSGRATSSPPSAPLAFFTFMMLLAPVTNREPHGVKFTGYCYAMRHGMKVQIVTPYRVSHLQRYGVTVRAVTLQVCTHL